MIDKFHQRFYTNYELAKANKNSACRLVKTNAIHQPKKVHKRALRKRKGRMNMMPLTLAGVGEEAIIKKVGGNPEVKKHLENLGFVVGGTVTVISMIGGNIIVNVKEARVAVSREMAQKIMV